MESLGLYELLSPIGQGGMAEVWLARRSMAGGPGKLVAIKRMAAGLAAQDHYREMFEAETRMSMTLSHSNIVQVFDYGTEQGSAYIVMELVDGVDLGSLISFVAQDEQAGTLPLSVSAFVTGELLRALIYSHNLSISSASLGLIHRDVSPQNLLISKAGEVKLTDFGVARLVDENTSGAQPKGKLRYMAPEQMSGKAMDARVDLFAVGAILFELLTGKHFRDADSVDQLYGQILESRDIVLPDDIPPALAELTRDLLAHAAGERIKTAKEALKRLTAWEGYKDARDELAVLVRACRPEGFVIPPPKDRLSVGDSVSPSPFISAADFAGQTQALVAPPRSVGPSPSATLPNAVPEHTTLPDAETSTGDVYLGRASGSSRRLLVVSGAALGLGGVALFFTPSLSEGLFGRSSEPGAGARVPVVASLVKPPASPPVVVPEPQTIVSAEASKPDLGASPSPPPVKLPVAIDSRDQAESILSKTPVLAPEPKSALKEQVIARQKRRRMAAARERRRQQLAQAREARRPVGAVTEGSSRVSAKIVRVDFRAHEFNYAYVKMAGRELLIEPLGTMKLPVGRHTVYVRENKKEPWRSFGSVQLHEDERAVLRLRRSGSVRVSRSAQ